MKTSNRSYIISTITIIIVVLLTFNIINSYSQTSKNIYPVLILRGYNIIDTSKYDETVIFFFPQASDSVDVNDCGKLLNTDPDYLTTPEGALKSALWFWNAHNLSTLADSDDILHITKKINGGTIGLEERTALYNKAKTVLAQG